MAGHRQGGRTPPTPAANDGTGEQQRRQKRGPTPASLDRPPRPPASGASGTPLASPSATGTPGGTGANRNRAEAGPLSSHRHRHQHQRSPSNHSFASAASSSRSSTTASARTNTTANDGPIADPARVYSTTRRIRMLLRRGMSSARSLGNGSGDGGSSMGSAASSVGGGASSGRHDGGEGDGGASYSSSSGGRRRRASGRPSAAPIAMSDVGPSRGGGNNPNGGSPRRSSYSPHRRGSSGGGASVSGGGNTIGATGSPYLHGMRDLPSARLGLRWSRSSLDGDDNNDADSNSKGDADNDDDNSSGVERRCYDPHRHDPHRVNALNRAQTALVEEGFVPSVPPCRTVDEALWALYELLSEGGRSPYDVDDKAVGGGGDGDVLDDLGRLGAIGAAGGEEYDWLLDGDCLDGVALGGACGTTNGNGAGSGDCAGMGEVPAASEEDYTGGTTATASTTPVPLEECIAEELRLELERWYRAQDGSDRSTGRNGRMRCDGIGGGIAGNQIIDGDDANAPEEYDRRANAVLVANDGAGVACEKVITENAVHSESESESSSLSEEYAEDGSLESLSDEDSVAPPLLLDLTVGRYADFLRSLPLAEPTSEEARFTRRAQIRLLQEVRRKGGGIAAGIVGEYGSDEELYSLAENGDESSDNSSLRTEEEEEEEVNDARKNTEGKAEGNSSGIISEEDTWLCRTAAEIEETLSDEYFSNETDPVLFALLAVPWDERPPTDPAYVHGNRASFDKMEPYDEYFSRQLSELDQVQRRVTKRLIAKVRQKRGALDRGMRRIQDLDLDIARAALEVEAGSNCLRRARGTADQADGLHGAGGLLGGLQIMKEADARDRLRSLCSVVEEVDGLFRTEATIMGLPFSVNEYLDRIGQANGLKQSVYRLGGGQLARLHCLAELRNRVDDVGDHLAAQMAVSLSLIVASRCDQKRLLLGREQMDCSSSCDHDAGFISQYATLLRARLVLAQQEGHIGNEKSAMTDWADCLADALSFEIDKCLAYALLDPTPTAQDSTKEECYSDFVQDLAHLRHQLSEIKGVNPNDKSKLRIIVHNLFTIRFDFESHSNHLPWIYHKFCSLVANVMQVYLEIDQWHSTPDEDQSSGESSIQCSYSKALSLADVQRRVENEASDEDETDWSTRLSQLFSELQSSKSALWRHCQSTFVKMLDHFIVQSTKNKSIMGGGDDEAGGDGRWAVQLEGLHDVWQLTKQINVLGTHFADDIGSDTLHTEWKDKLSQIFRSHLRGVHVESMNTMGAMLAHETWMLLPIPIDSTTSNTYHSCPKNLKIDHKPGYEAKDALKNTLESLCPLQFVDSRVLASTGRRSWDNLLLDGRESLSLFNYESANPFLERRNAEASLSNRRTQLLSTDSSTSALPQQYKNHSKEAQTDLVDSLYQAMSPFIIQDPTGQHVLTAATQGSMNGLGKWMARLLKVMDKLPLIAADVTKVISNLVDMYLLTVFRLCCRNGSNEDAALGILRDVSEDSDHGDSPPKAGGHSRQSSSGSLGSPIPLARPTSHPVNPISDAIEAEICAPQPRDKDRLTSLREFVLRGQESLSGMVNLRMVEKWDAISSAIKGPTDPKREVKDAACILERQISAAVSCLYVAALLDVALDRLKHPRKEGVRASSHRSISSFVSYAMSVIEVAPSLTTLSVKMACARAIKGKRIVLEVMMVGSAWKDHRFSEHSNDYVDAMCLRCARIWEALSSSPRKLPTHSLFEVWKQVVSCSFLSLLEGFSKVVICSMEGRALMSMDLATYYAGCNPDAVEYRIQGIFRVSSEPPPSISAIEDMQYVDAYVKAFYFPEEDLISWIEGNMERYHLRHMVGLLSCAAAEGGWKERKVQDLMKKVQEMYK